VLDPAESLRTPGADVPRERAKQAPTSDGRGRRALLLLARALPPPASTDRASLDVLQRELATAVLRIAAVAMAGAQGQPRLARALRSIRRSLDGAASSRRGWPALCALFHDRWWRGVGLFRSGACASVEGAHIEDRALAAVLDCLSTNDGGDDDAFDWQAAPIEQLGSIYEGMLGVRLAVSSGRAAAVGPRREVLELDALLQRPAAARAEAVAEATGWSPAKRACAALACARSIDELATALGDRGAVDILPPGSLHLQSTSTRRRAGAHYTPLELTRTVVDATLRPLLGGGRSPLELTVCDPAMGCGAFLLEACRWLAERLPNDDPRAKSTGLTAVAERCLYGVDADPLAVEVARTSMWLLLEGGADDAAFLDRALHVGDALVGAAPDHAPHPVELSGLTRALGITPLDWTRAFPEIFSRTPGGFDACLGNPPWVAYAGRAAEPLADGLFEYYRRHNPAFHGYRTLHGLFVQRAATLLRDGGRLGLIVPTSVADLQGYAPTRRAHDQLCDVDPELPDFGADAFRGVFQPAMAVLSTRRPVAPPPSLELGGASHASTRSSSVAANQWRLARTDLDPVTEALLARLARVPTLPPSAFGERGFQSSGEDADRLRALVAPEAPFVLPIREGSDIASFVARPPRLYLDPSATRSRLRPEEQWRQVQLLIRQTARFPIAALGDGVAFRNSILAGFAVPGISELGLLAWLNASPIRWYHYMKHRDARQGMPQVKIAHLRALPAPPPGAGDLVAVGERLGKRNEGASQRDRDELDALVADLLDMNAGERDAVARWAQAFPAP
jgi:hypothetical protein